MAVELRDSLAAADNEKHAMNKHADALATNQTLLVKQQDALDKHAMTGASLERGGKGVKIRLMPRRRGSKIRPGRSLNLLVLGRFSRDRGKRRRGDVARTMLRLSVIDRSIKQISRQVACHRVAFRVAVPMVVDR